MALELLSEGALIPGHSASRPAYLLDTLIPEIARDASVPVETATFKERLFTGWELMVRPEAIYQGWIDQQQWLNVLVPNHGDSLWSAQLVETGPRATLELRTTGSIHRSHREGDVLLAMGQSGKFKMGLEGVITQVKDQGWQLRPLWLFREQFRRSHRLALNPAPAVGVLPFHKKPGQTVRKMYLENISKGGALIRSDLEPARDLLVTLPVGPGEPALIARGSTRHVQPFSGGFRFGIQWDAATQKFDRYQKWVDQQEILQKMQGLTSV